VPGISGISDEYLLITNFTHKDGPNISARTMSAPTAKTIFYPLKEIILCMFYATVTGLVYEEQMDNVSKHQLEQSA
jgi:hypothetical protein